MRRAPLIVIALGLLVLAATALPSAALGAAPTPAATGPSSPVTFQVSTAAPAIVLNAPTASGVVTVPDPIFTGTASTGLGYAGTVSLSIYPGASSDAAPVAVDSGPVSSSGGFQIQVSPGLAAGQYTAVAEQSNLTGEAFSNEVTFTVSTAPPGGSSSPPTGSTNPPTGSSNPPTTTAPASRSSVTLSRIAFSRGGVLTAPVACSRGTGACTGEVLIDTRASLRTVSGGPRGPLRLMFARFTLAAGGTRTLRARIPGSALAALRRGATARALRVTLSYTLGGSRQRVAATTKPVEVPR